MSMALLLHTNPIAVVHSISRGTYPERTASLNATKKGIVVLTISFISATPCPKIWRFEHMSPGSWFLFISSEDAFE